MRTSADHLWGERGPACCVQSQDLLVLMGLQQVSSPTSCLRQVSYGLLRDLSSWVVETIKDRGCTTSLAPPPTARLSLG